jgi:hypothetical protein
MRGNEEHQAMGGSHFMIQQLGLHVTPPRSTDWGSHPDSRHASYDLSGMKSSYFGVPSPLSLLMV